MMGQGREWGVRSMSSSDADQGSAAVPSRDSADTQVALASSKGEGYDLSRGSLEDFGFVYEGKLHIRTEFVSGLQVTFAHILAHPNPWILEDLQLGPFPNPEKVALGLVNCMPVELLPVIVDLMAKSSNVDIQIADRFMGTIMLTGTFSAVRSAMQSSIAWLGTHISGISLPAEITTS